jgi:hypothetical protein
LKDGGVASCGCIRREVGAALGRSARIYSVDNSAFSKIDSPESAYWLGFILTDGNISKDRRILQIQLQTRDNMHLEKFADFISTDMPVKVWRNKCYLSVSSKPICDNLINIGVMPQKTLHTKSLHDSVPDEFHRDYWRGVVDGDGTLFIGTGTYKYPTLALIGDFHLMEAFCDLCERICGKRPKNHKEINSWVASLHTHSAIKMAEYLYSGASVYLDRKYQKYVDFGRIRFVGNKWNGRCAHLRKKVHA